MVKSYVAAIFGLFWSIKLPKKENFTNPNNQIYRYPLMEATNQVLELLLVWFSKDGTYEQLSGIAIPGWGSYLIIGESWLKWNEIEFLYPAHMIRNWHWCAWDK